MKIYTSYYGNLKNLPNDIKKISISTTIPKKIVCDSYAPAAPPPEILKKYKQNEINEQEYEQEYMQYLNTLDAQKVIHHLRKLARNKDIVLLCYEKSEDFCHRHIFIKWLKEVCNMQIQICGEFSQI